MCSNPSRYLGITLLLIGLLSVAGYPSEAGQSPTAPIPTYIFGRADFLVGNQPVALASGDFNGDGQPDLVVVNQNNNTISILLGKPDGTFAPQAVYATGPLPTAVTVGDFNRDGNLDIAVVNQNCTIQSEKIVGILVCATGTVSILLGNGDGTFGPHTDYTVGTQPVSVAAADFNGDGNLDLVVANANQCLITISVVDGACGSGSVSVLLGDGAGGFQPSVSYSTATGPFSLVLADFNGDHKLDIAIAGGTSLSSSLPGNVSVLLGNGDGTFQNHIDSTLGASAGYSLVAADFDGDGKIDLASAGGKYVDIMIGNGDGTFIFKQHYPGGNAVAAADLNHDGKADLAVLVATNNYSAAVMLGNGDGTFQTAVQYSTGVNPQSLLAVDLNGDGKLDLVAPCQQYPLLGLPGLVSVDLGLGDGTFGGPTLVGPGNPVGNSALAITSADLNGDGKQDIATLGAVFLGNGDGTFQTSINPGNFVPDSTANFVGAGDFNGDGKTDLAVVNTLCQGGTICNPGSVSIFLGTGDFSNTTPGPYQPRVDYAVGVMPDMLTIGDFNGDSKIDLGVANGMGYPSGSISILSGKGDGTFQQQLQTSFPAMNWIANGDFDGDGKLDVAVLTFSSVVIELGNGDGTFHQGSSYSFSGSGGTSITAADLNHDGKLDLAVTRNAPPNNTPVVSVFLGNGDGTFQPPSDYPTLGLGLVQAADFNGDGKLDLMTTGDLTPSMILTGNGDGTFRLPVAYFTLDGSTSPFTIADFNQDGVPDVASIGFDGSVGVMLSTPFASVSPATLNFGGQGVGTMSPMRTVTISNGSNVPFSITGAVASGSFSATNNCGTLQPGASCTITVKLTPSATGAQTGTLTITDSTRTSPQIVALTGTGVNGPVLTAFPSRYTFNAQLVQMASSSPVAIQLLNTGNASLTLNSIGIAGPNGPDFGQTNNCGSSLAAGASCTVNVSFAPVVEGLRSANISVSDSETGSPQLIPLFGAGNDFQMSASAFSPASIAAGSSATSTVAITSLGAFSGSVALLCASPLPTSVSCSFNPATVTASTAGAVSSTLTVNTTANASPATYSLTIAGISGGLSHAASQALTVQSSQPPAFSLAPSSSGSSSASVTAGQSAKFTLSATSTNGFSGTINLTCAVSPAPTNAPKCTVPATVQVAAGTPGSFSVTVATTAATSAQLWTPSGFQNMWAALVFSGLFVMAFALVRVGNGTNNKRRNYALASLLLFAFALVGCGGGGSSSDGGGGATAGTPAGSYSVTVTGTSGSVKQTSTLTLTVN
jgi:hypothetical protein